MSYNPYKKYCSSWWIYWLNLPHDIWFFIRKMWDYAPILWEDMDCDYIYLLRLMRFKIRRMRDLIGEDDFIAHTEDVVAEMAKADVLLRNVVDEDPDDEWSEHYNQFCIYKKITDPCGNEELHLKALRLTALRDKRNWLNLWKYLSKHAQGWWD